MSSAFVDPISQTMQAICGILNASPGVMNLMKPGNVIDVTNSKWTLVSWLKEDPGPGDLPEVVLLRDTDTWEYPETTNSQALGAQLRFALAVTTDVADLVPLNMLHLAIAAAIYSGPHNLGVSANGFSIWHCRVAREKSNDGASGKGPARESQRWWSATEFIVDCSFDYNYLRAIAAGNLGA